MTKAWAVVGVVLFAGFIGFTGIARAQEDEPLVIRPAPPKLDDFESDENKDGVPDGWYNLRDAKVVVEGGVVGPRYLKFECTKPGRPARLSRAFGVDGKKYEAIVIGLWVRVDQIQAGERLGDDPGLMIDFLGPKLRQTTRGSMGPWTMRSMGALSHWTRVAKRIPVPPETRDAIMTVGLLGATGVLDVDGLTVDLVAVEGVETTNLLKNPDFELGDPDAAGWISDNGARRGFPGFESNTALELAKSGARSMTGLAVPVDTFGSLVLSLKVKGIGLRGSGGAAGALFFVNEDGRVLADPASGKAVGVSAFRWAGTFDWREERVVLPVTPGASRAVLQFEKLDGLGSVKIDDVEATGLNPEAGKWTPYHAKNETDRWLPVTGSTGIEAKSALDFSFLLGAPAGKAGRVEVKGGRLHFSSGARARFLGVQLLPPTAFLPAAKADALADHLARSGINLVRFGDLDTPLGPDRSLFDDTRDDTKIFDEVAIGRMDHLIAALKKRGIYYAVELQGSRRYRVDDGVTMPGALPPGGGPAAVFDPVLKKQAMEAGIGLLKHVNAETGLAMKDDPGLAWVTLSGEVTLFNMIDEPGGSLPGDYGKAYRDLAAKSTTGIGRRFWQGVESSHWKEVADALRKEGLKAPLAGVSHWRRELEFSESQAAPGLDLVDDRIYWYGPTWMAPRWRSMLWSVDGGMLIDASRKRRQDRPYVVGQWCDFTQGVWAYPYEAAEQMLAVETARTEDWDALVRRGLFVYPEAWGSSAPGTSGGEDIFQLPEVSNAAPQVFAMWPHEASILLRGNEGLKGKSEAGNARRVGAGGKSKRHAIAGWEAERGRLVIETAYTQGVAGWPGEEVVTLPEMIFDVENPYAAVVASSASEQPISGTKRLLVTAIARVTPTGFRWVDEWRRETADPGRPPLLAEPVKGKVTWRNRKGVKGYALDNNGKRIGEAKVVESNEGTSLVLDGTIAALNWEMVVEGEK